MSSPVKTAPGAGYERPLFKELDDAVEHTDCLRHSRRRLTKSIRDRAFCHQFDGCPLNHNFRLVIDIALEEISREWDLKG